MKRGGDGGQPLDACLHVSLLASDSKNASACAAVETDDQNSQDSHIGRQQLEAIEGLIRPLRDWSFRRGFVILVHHFFFKS